MEKPCGSMKIALEAIATVFHSSPSEPSPATRRNGSVRFTSPHVSYPTRRSVLR
jgi:hypothetical protein